MLTPTGSSSLVGATLATLSQYSRAEEVALPGRRRDEGNIGGRKLLIVGHPHTQLTAEGGCRRTAACDPRIETSCDGLFANAVATAPPMRPVPITTIFLTLLLLGLAALRRSMDQGTAKIFPVGLLPFR
jgi:hypothetical protein